MAITAGRGHGVADRKRRSLTKGLVVAGAILLVIALYFFESSSGDTPILHNNVWSLLLHPSLFFVGGDPSCTFSRLSQGFSQ